MAKNYIPSRSSWPHEPGFPSHTGYEQSVDQWWRTSDNENARSPAAQSVGRRLRHRKPSRQVHTNALVAATQVKDYTKGGFVQRLSQAIQCK